MFNIENLPLIISICSFFFGGGSLITCAKFINRRIQQEKEKQEREKLNNELQNKALQLLLRANLINEYKNFEAQGNATISEKNMWLEQYDVYHSLGKNGVMDAIKDKVFIMPIRVEE